jgi:hypothetical protein
MRSVIISGLLFFAMAFSISAQTVAQTKPDDASKTTSPTKQTDVYVRPDGKTRFNRYLNSMFGPVSLGKNIATAGIATARNSPEEWGPHWEGFGKRVASNLGKSVIKNSVQFGLDEAFSLDSHYYRSKDRSLGGRVGNALISTVAARDKNGHRTVGFPRILGTYSASVIAAETWYPARYTWKDGLKNGTVSLGFTAAFNLIKEFWKK